MRLITLIGFMLLMAAIFSVTSFVIYTKTRDSYQSAGFNSGIVKANFDLLQKIRTHGEVIPCESLKGDTELTSLVKVKADEIYLARHEGKVLFCEPQ